MTAAPTTTFRVRRFALWFYLLLGTFVGLQGAATAAYFIWFDTPEFPFGPVIFGISAFMVALGIWFVRITWRRLADPEPPIVIGPAGIHDRILSHRPIPWKAVSRLAVRHVGRGGLIIAFDIAPDAVRSCGVRLGSRLAARFNAGFGYTYRIHHMGTDATPRRLVDAIQPYATFADTALAHSLG